MRYINGHCSKCGSIVRVKDHIDNLGNKVQTISCWNGHYEKVHVEGIEPGTSKKHISESLPFISFYDGN